MSLNSLRRSATAVAQPPAAPAPPAPSADEKKAAEAFTGGKFDDALKLLQEVAKQNPMVVPKVTMSRWFAESGQGQQARALLEQAASEDPAHPTVLLLNAGYALNEGRFTDAILSCEAVLAAVASPRWGAEAKKTYQKEARLALLAGFRQRRDFASARTHLAALLEADPQNPKLRVQLGQVNFAMNLPDDALAEFTRARKDDPTIEPPELLVAKLWAEKSAFSEAEAWFNKAAQAHPAVAAVHRGQASYMLDRGRADAAKPHLEAAQKIEPAARETKAIAGLLARYKKDYAAATAIFEELVREYPNLPFATVNLAIVLSESADANLKRRALELAQGYAQQNPKVPEAHAVLGYVLLKNDRAAEAEKQILTAASLGGLSPDGGYFLARVFDKNGKVEDAHKVLKDSLASQLPFVYRADAQALFDDLAKRLPPPKK